MNFKCKLIIVLGMIVLAIFSSCDCTYQYGVYVKNEHSEALQIKYKSIHDNSDQSEKVIQLAPGGLKRILWTRNIDTGDGCLGTRKSHCRFVAEYVSAYIRDSIPSKLQWCDDQIQFQKTDIQQAEFTIVYSEDDF